MKEKILTLLIIINIIFVCIFYNLVSTLILNNQKQILKDMSEIEYEDTINSINASHTNYFNYIQETKSKLASAITNMGVETSDQESLETMVNNIKSLPINFSSLNYLSLGSIYSNTNSASLTKTNLPCTDAILIIGYSAFYMRSESSNYGTISLSGDLTSSELLFKQWANTGNYGNCIYAYKIKTPLDSSITISIALEANSNGHLNAAILY